MTETILGLLATMLCIGGAASVIKWFALRISASGSKGKRIYAVMLQGRDADIELQMAIETVSWDSALATADVFAVDCGIDNSVLEYCKELCDSSRFVYIKQEDFGVAGLLA